MKQHKIFILLLFFAELLFSQNTIFKKEVIGQSLEKRQIEVFKFGSGNNVLLIISGVHGNSATIKAETSYLMELIRQNKIKISADKALWVLPELNPDGILKVKKTNENGVDLNRNFLTDTWKKRFFYINNSFYAGEEPFSEPEAKALKVFIESLDKNIKPVIISLYSGDNAVIPGNLSPANIKLTEVVARNSGFKAGYSGYGAGGSLAGWLSDKLGFPSLNILIKNKSDIQSFELDKIADILLNIDFKEDVFKHDIKNNSQKIYTKDEVFYFFQNNIPEKTLKKINSNENADEFIRLYQSLRLDEELLILVNKKFNLLSEYKPGDIVVINGDFAAAKKNIMLRKILINDLGAMYNAALQENIKLVILSGYRSFEEQKNIFSYWEKSLGIEEAKRVSAAPGASQHQLGTAIDFNSLEFSFTTAKEGVWLKENAYKYGFVLSFPEGMEELTGFRYEPWHYRYVGKNASLMVYKYFDNMLEEFLNWYWETKYN